jgi:hypothetical protein
VEGWHTFEKGRSGNFVGSSSASEPWGVVTCLCVAGVDSPTLQPPVPTLRLVGMGVGGGRLISLHCVLLNTKLSMFLLMGTRLSCVGSAAARPAAAFFTAARHVFLIAVLDSLIPIPHFSVFFMLFS